MVYTGQPSRGCDTCRKRRIKCDERKPECLHCVRTKRKCPGYRDQFDLAWRDQTVVAKKSVERGKRGHKKEERERHHSSSSSSTQIIDLTPIVEDFQEFSPPTLLPTPSPSPTLRGPPEDHALCFFFTRYVLPQRDPLARRGFLEYTLPIYSRSGPHSPLKLSIQAVATSMLSGAMNQGDDPPLARSFYLGAVQHMKERVIEQRDCADDELLMAVMLLQMYEQLVGRTKKNTSPKAHLDGALALIKHRGVGNFKGDVSRGLLYYVRSVFVEECTRNAKPMPRGIETWSELSPDSDQIPTVRLDTIMVDIANLQAYSLPLLNTTELPAGVRFSRLMQTINYLTDIDDRLTSWSWSLPSTWAPIRVSGKQSIPPNIPQAGLYEQYCDVYASIFIASLWNKLRLSQIRTKNLIIGCLSQVKATPNNIKLREACQLGIQQAVDDICASVPFNIGDRMQPEDKIVHYPMAPGRPVPNDHYQSGPAMGGWSLLQPLGAVWGMKLKMRDGQRQWIGGQMARIARIYGIRRGKG
ncbi:White-opaque regulator 2 [Hyphodiscus hymeniophilus]|uniref:White-opaque regulator 2 n=1 Tax=Hyphodiscus hymeniophilus TaxID=353542 RepID=A0A9P6VG09_9HELO|nr:White-opaque regulator 2 [Hyphodiscus hymeniophilus]